MFEQDLWERNRLHWAAASGDLKEVTWLLARGMSMETKDSGQMSAFRLAIKGNHLDVVKYMVSKGATVTKIQMNEAERNGYKELLRFLRKTFFVQATLQKNTQPQQVVSNPHPSYKAFGVQKRLGK